MSIPAPSFSVSSHKLMISRSLMLTALLLLFFSWPTKKGLWLGKLLSEDQISVCASDSCNYSPVPSTVQRSLRWKVERDLVANRVFCPPSRGVTVATLFPEGIPGAKLLWQSLQRLCFTSPPRSVLSALFLNAPSFGPSAISVTESNMYRLYDRWHSFQRLLGTTWYLGYFVTWLKFLKSLRHFCLEDSYS